VPFRPVQEIVQAARNSTEKYLDFLRKNDRGIDKYTVDQLIEIPQLLLIEGKTQYQYLCRLPCRLRIHSDSSAVYVPREDPARQIPVYIVSYDRRSGRTKLASQEKISSQGGQLSQGETLTNGGKLIIDFRWLIRRCLEWFEERGGQVVSLDNLDVRKKVEWETAEKLISEVPDPPSSEQWAAIKTILCNDLSYVWGPPGTGKTKHVLAKAIYALSNQEQKTLVLASTNLAVDNALESILEFVSKDKISRELVPKDKVARLGIPSECFLDRYPECCEQRAFESEIGELNKRIKDLVVEREAIEELRTLELDIEHSRDQLRIYEETIPQKQSLIERLSTFVEAEVRRVEMVEKDLERAKETLLEMQRESNSLRIPELNNEIESNESLSTVKRQTISEYRHELDNLGFFSRFLTKKATKLNTKINNTEGDLKQIEATLQSIRQRRDQRLVRYEELNTIICKEAQRIKDSERNLHTAQMELAKQHSTLDTAKRNLLTCEKQIQSLYKAVDTASIRFKELTLHFQSFDTIPMDEKKAVIEEEIEKLEEKKKEFELDLSKKSVIGMTLDGFIGFSMNTSLTVDRIFVDEATYAPVVKILPLLSLKRPIALLGDNKQLPPICEDENDCVIMSYWAKGAHFLEDIFELGSDFEEIHNLSEAHLKPKILTISYRFGERLAKILDAHVYNIGLQGWGEMDTKLYVCDCEPRYVKNAKNRENYSEADTIVSYIRDFTEKYPNEDDRPSVVVLTPYINQANLIRKKLRDEQLFYEVDVLNTHKAQGREWDWVLFSISDTKHPTGASHHRPFYTDSKIPVGQLVLNTTISRARIKLILFLDKAFWSERKCLIGNITRVANEQ